MDWKILIAFVLFPTIVYVMRAILGKEEEQRQSQRRLPQRPPSRPRQSGTDMERFLEEINRRRREAASPRPSTPVPKRPTVVVPPPRPKTAAKPTPERRQQPTITDVVAVEEVVAVPKQQPGPARGATAPVPQADRTPPLLKELRALLASPKNARSAILLQEVLGRPLSQRGNRSYFSLLAEGLPRRPNG
jgi:hypothetical protein